MKVFIPYENQEIDLDVYLSDILEFHSQNSPYWQKILSHSMIEEAITGNLDEMLFNLSKLEVDPNLLRTRWQDFKPRKLKSSFCSFSSGTTGPQKYCIWSKDYIVKQADYLTYYFSKQDIGIKNAIIQGPSSVYKDFNEMFINNFGGIPYFVGIRVEGIKPIIEDASKKGPQELIRAIKEYFGPEIEKTRRFLEYDSDINFMRSAWMMLAPFEIFFGDKKNIETVMVSGLGYTPQNHEMLRQKFKNVIPSYGYFAFGDALGMYSNGNLNYYPAFPYAISSVVKENGEIAKYGEEGNPLFIIARKDLFLVQKESNEYSRRAQPTEGFNWDGISNPHRNIG